MPAIATTASPLGPQALPAARSTANGTPGADTGDRPFAAVLKEKVSTPESDRSSSAASTADSGQTAAGADPSIEGAVAAQWIHTGLQVAQQPSDAVLSEFSDDQSSKAAIDAALLALTAPARNSNDPAATVIAANAVTGEHDSKLIAGLAALPTPTNGSETLPGSDSFEQAISDIRVAMSRSTSGSVSPPSDAGNSPAKYAAPLEKIALEAETLAARETTTSSGGDRANLLVETGPASMVPTNTTTTTSVASRHGEIPIASSLGTPHWENSIGNSLVVMSGRQQDRAELVLNPPNLGRVEVSLSLKGDDASVTFVSSNPLVRDALENALPRLKEILADAGITLGQTQVGSESPGQTAKEGQNRDNSHGGRSGDIATNGTLDPDLAHRESASHRRMSLMLVDTYA